LIMAAMVAVLLIAHCSQSSAFFLAHSPLVGVRRSQSSPSRTPFQRAYTCVLSSEDQKGRQFSTWFEDRPEEVPVPVKLQVEGGAMPEYVRGSLIRNGPALWRGKDRAYEHAFDGLAKLSKYSINDTTITFSTKFIKSEWYKKIVTDKESLPPSVTVGKVRPPFSQLQNIMGLMTATALDNAPVNIHQIGGEGGPWAAVTDPPVAMEFDPITLESSGRRLELSYNSIVSFGGAEIFSTAHPSTCPLTGQTLNYFLEVNPIKNTNTALIVRTDNKLHRTVLGRVPVGSELPLVHDFSVTAQGKVILVICPVRTEGMLDFVKGPYFDQVRWKPELNTRVFVFDLSSAGTEAEAAHEVSPLFVYHHINAFDREDGGVTVDLCGYATAEIVTGDNGFLSLPRMKEQRLRRLQTRDGELWRLELPNAASSSSKATLQRVKLTRAGQTVESSSVASDSDPSFELPRVSPAVKGRPYSFFYGYTGFENGKTPQADFTDWAIVKGQLVPGAVLQGEIKTWSEANVYPSEPIFIPDPDGTHEDDGTVLVTAYDAERHEGLLVWLDAKHMTEIGRAYCGSPVPMAFHGQFLPL